MNKCFVFFLLTVSFLCLYISCHKDKQTDSYESVHKVFQDPPIEYRSVPFWVWNDSITREQIERQLMDFQQKGIGGVFIHPRPGSFREGAKMGYPSGLEYSVVAYGLFEEFNLYSSSQTTLVTHHRSPSK